MLQVLDPDGQLVGDDPDLDDKELLELYRLMVLSRQFDRKAVSLQRQGRIGTYPMLEGHEAAQIGSAFALGSENWVYPSYREHGVQLARGLPIEVVLSYWRGLPNRDWDVHKYRMNITTVPIASQLPHAVGHAYAARLSGEDLVTATYFGDGATSENDFHSGMNFAGVWNVPTVFICANNLWAISVPVHMQTAARALSDKAIGYGMPGRQVDGMDVLATYTATREAVDRARNGGGPTFIEAMTYRFGAHATADDARLYRSEEKEQAWRAKDPIERLRKFLIDHGKWSSAIDEQIDQEVASQVTQAIETIESWELPERHDSIRHAYSRIPIDLVRQLTTAQRRDGQTETEFDSSDLWEIGDDNVPEGPTRRWTMAEAINGALHEGMDARPETVLLGQDVAKAGGVFRITEGLLDTFGDDRVIDTPLSETGIVGTAVGMATAGARVIAEIQFDGFVYPTFDQIVSHLARTRFRTRGNVHLPIVVRWPNGGGIGAHEFHCDSPEAYFAHTAGLTVVIPSTPIDAKGLLAAALASEDPVIFLEPKVLYRGEREDVPSEHYTLPIGRARIRRAGGDLTIVTYGGMVPVALEAAETLAAAGVDAEVIDLRTLKPWDRETVLSSVEKTGRLVLVQEPARTAGIAAEVSATVAEEAIFSLKAPIIRVTGFDAPWPQFAVEDHALITQQRVASACHEAMA